MNDRDIPKDINSTLPGYNCLSFLEIMSFFFYLVHNFILKVFLYKKGKDFRL